MKRKLFFFSLALIHTTFAGWSVLSWTSNETSLYWARDLSGEEKEIILAVPPGTRSNLDYKILGERVVSQPAQAPSFQINLSERGRFRDLEIQSLSFNSFYSTFTGTKQVDSLKVLIRYQANEKKIHRPIFASELGSPAEKALQSMLGNYAQSRTLRFSEIKPLYKPAEKGGPQTPIRLWVKTKEEKIHVLTPGQLSQAGVPVSKIDPRKIRLYDGDREVPIYIQGQEDGRWDEKDELEFIGKRPSGTPLGNGRQTHNSFYALWAVFQLTWEEPGTGLRAPLVPANKDVNAAEAKPFHLKYHLEEDNETLRLGGVAVADVLDLGTQVQEKSISDFWFWQEQGVATDAVDIPFELPYQPLLRSGLNFNGVDLKVRVRLQGLTDVLTAPFDHHVRFLINAKDISQTGGNQNTAKWAGAEPYEWESETLDPQVLKAGRNVLTLQKVNDLVTTAGLPVDNQNAYLDYLELEFFSEYRVVEDQLDFTTSFPDSLGKKAFLLKGLKSNTFSLWDKVGRKLTGFELKVQAGETHLAFADQVVQFTNYILTSREKRKVPVLKLDSLHDLRDWANQADFIVLTDKVLAGKALDSLVAHRTSQGLKVQVVYLDHVYQLFGDGSMDPTAIRDFVAYAYSHWQRPAPLYLLLLGDATLWFEKAEGGFQRNITPTHLIHIPGWGVTSNDDYFAKVSGDDDVADLFVGRIPAASRAELSSYVQKILKYETERSAGSWKNRTLMLGGYEKSFTTVNDELMRIAATNGRTVSRFDVEESSPFYRAPGVGPSVYSQLDSAYNLVSFVGHGGGAVWSDAGLLTLDELDKDSLRGPYSTPLVLSFTCLTGFFEDVAARSLGEELIKRPQSGALGFYGASGYISNEASRRISSEMFRVLGKSSISIGAAVQQAEALVALKTGKTFAPILGEFDLLGDPAMPLHFPAEGKKIRVTSSENGSNHILGVSASGLSISSGEGELTVYVGDSAIQTTGIQVAQGAITRQLSFPKGNLARFLSLPGKVAAHYWSGNSSYLSQVEFSWLDWFVDSVQLNPVLPKMGDSIQFQFSLAKLPGTLRLVAGSAQYAISDESPKDLDTEVLLQQGTGSHFQGVRKIALTHSLALTNPSLYLRFRLSVESTDGQGNVTLYSNIVSKIYSLPISIPSDLGFLSPALRLPPQQDLGVWVRVVNRGLGSDSAYKIVVEQVRTDITVPPDTAHRQRRIGASEVDTVFFSLNEESLTQRLRIRLLSGNGGEFNTNNNFLDTILDWKSKGLTGTRDSVFLVGSGPLVTGETGKSLRLFYRPYLDSILVPPHLKKPNELDSVNTLFELMIGGVGMGKIHSFPAHLTSSHTGRWHYFHEPPGQWIKLDLVDSAQGALSAVLLSHTGLYGFFQNSDTRPPTIEITSAGQRLLEEDFIPQGNPLDISIRDDVGVDLFLHRPGLRNKDGEFDTSRWSGGALSQDARAVAMRFAPDKSAERDSIEVLAKDVSGNETRKSFSFKLGRGFRIQIIGSYPNPFADSAVFVYELTDRSDKMKVQIFSQSGRPVRRFSVPQNVTGYQELIWNGRSNAGVDVANGLYYLKITAQKGGKKSSDIFKLFRKKRK